MTLTMIFLLFRPPLLTFSKAWILMSGDKMFDSTYIYSSPTKLGMFSVYQTLDVINIYFRIEQPRR
jgi:hypothetical protein